MSADAELAAAVAVCRAVEHNPTSNQKLEDFLRAWRKIHDTQKPSDGRKESP